MTRAAPIAATGRCRCRLESDGLCHFPQMDRQEMLLEELAPVGPAHVPPDIHLESPALQVMVPAPEAPVAEAWIPQAGLPELGYGAAGDCQPFLDPGKARVCLPFCGSCFESSRAPRAWGWVRNPEEWMEAGLCDREEGEGCRSGNGREQSGGHHVGSKTPSAVDPAQESFDQE